GEAREPAGGRRQGVLARDRSALRRVRGRRRLQPRAGGREARGGRAHVRPDEGLGAAPAEERPVPGADRAVHHRREGPLRREGRRGGARRGEDRGPRAAAGIRDLRRRGRRGPGSGPAGRRGVIVLLLAARAFGAEPPAPDPATIPPVAPAPAPAPAPEPPAP